MRDWQAPTRKILAVVAVVHALLLALLLASAFLRKDEADEMPLLGELIPVGMDDATVAALNLPPVAELPGPETPPPTAPEPPQPVAAEPPTVQPPAPEPPQPEPPQPEPVKPEPEPVKIVVPKPEPVKTVVPKPEPPKPTPPKPAAPKPEPIRPVPPKVETPTPPKATPTPPKATPTPPKATPTPPKATAPAPKTAYRTAADILKSANLKPATAAPRPVTPLPAFDARSIAGNLQKGLDAVHIDSTPSAGRAGSPAGSPGGSPNGSARNADGERRWHAALSAELYRLWAQPTRSEVGGGNPTVRVSLKITADGHVAEARVIGASGVTPMDATVRQLLAALSSLPGFTSFGLDGASRTVTVTFKLTT